MNRKMTVLGLKTMFSSTERTNIPDLKKSVLFFLVEEKTGKLTSLPSISLTEHTNFSIVHSLFLDKNQCLLIAKVIFDVTWL